MNKSTHDDPIINRSAIPEEFLDQIDEKINFLATKNDEFVFPIGGAHVTFFPELLAAHMKRVRKDIADGKSLTLKDLTEKRGPANQKQKGEFFAIGKSDTILPGIAPIYRFEPLDWPREDVLPGVTAVVGQMYSGKTHYVRETADVDIVIRFGEPFEDIDLEKSSDTDPKSIDVIQATSFLDALEKTMIFSLLGFRVAIDSFRKLVFSLNGPALTGGIIPTIFDVMTNVNNLFSLTGTHALITVNPMLKEESALHKYFELMAASTSRAVLIQDKATRLSTARTSKGRVYDISDVSGVDVFDNDSGVRADPAEPLRGLNTQVIPNRSEIDGVDNSLADPAAPRDDDAKEPARRGTNFNL